MTSEPKECWMQVGQDARVYIAEKLAKINARAVKIGSAGLTVEYTGQTQQFNMPGTAEFAPYVISREQMLIHGEPPKIAGWSFVARLEHTAAGNLIYAVPGVECPAVYQATGPDCDHCKQVRDRKNLYVVRDDAGQYKQVGSTCLRDFLGHDLPTGFDSIFRDLADPDLMEGWRDLPEHNLHGLLARTQAVVRTFGWLSRSKADIEQRVCSADLVAAIYYSPPNSSKQEMIDKIGPVTEADEATAKAVQEWAAGLADGETAGSNYLLNLRTMAQGDTFTDKSMSFACSMIGAYKRATEAARERVVRPESKHVGAVGERRKFTATCHRVFESQGNYGVTGIHKMTDRDGNDLTWFASSAKWLDEGKTYNIVATVKAHDAYKDRPQTVITRVKIIKEIEK